MFLQIVFLPEGCDYIASNKEESKKLAEPLTGELMSEYKSLAQNHQVWLSVGGFHELICHAEAEGGEVSFSKFPSPFMAVDLNQYSFIYF